MCHYYICLYQHPNRENVNSLKTWVEYLFPIVDEPLESLQIPMTDRKIARPMNASRHENVVLEEDDGEHEQGDTF